MVTRPLATAGGRSSQAGYNMVMLIVAITVLNILLAAVMPLMSTQIRREKEEELVFRGLQYAEAIRLFKQRFGSYPTQLDQLLKAKPRCIRQLWKDPMTADGKWGLIFQNQGQQINPPNGQNPNGQPQDPQAGGNGDSGTTDPNGQPGVNGTKKGDVVAVGPIVGVYSKSSQKSFLLFFQHNRYDEWRFTDDLLRGGSGGGRGGFGGAPGIGNPGQVVLPDFSVRWLGRPMPFTDKTQPANGTMPDGSPGGAGTGSGQTTGRKGGTGSSGKP
jgi:type II secretory pathway pseudopilin PulG